MSTPNQQGPPTPPDPPAPWIKQFDPNHQQWLFVNPTTEPPTRQWEYPDVPHGGGDGERGLVADGERGLGTWIRGKVTQHYVTKFTGVPPPQKQHGFSNLLGGLFRPPTPPPPPPPPSALDQVLGAFGYAKPPPQQQQPSMGANLLGAVTGKPPRLPQQQPQQDLTSQLIAAGVNYATHSGGKPGAGGGGNSGFEALAAAAIGGLAHSGGGGGGGSSGLGAIMGALGKRELDPQAGGGQGGRPGGQQQHQQQQYQQH